MKSRLLPTQTYLKKDEQKLVKEASEKIGLNISAFLRMTILRESRKILEE